MSRVQRWFVRGWYDDEPGDEYEGGAAVTWAASHEEAEAEFRRHRDQAGRMSSVTATPESEWSAYQKRCAETAAVLAHPPASEVQGAEPTEVIIDDPATRSICSTTEGAHVFEVGKFECQGCGIHWRDVYGSVVIGDLVDAAPPPLTARERGESIHYWIKLAAAAWVEERERAARTVAVSHLPRRMLWLVNHPRLLRLFYRLRPSWRPMVVTPGMLDGVPERDPHDYYPPRTKAK